MYPVILAIIGPETPDVAREYFHATTLAGYAREVNREAKIDSFGKALNAPPAAERLHAHNRVYPAQCQSGRKALP